MAEGEYFELERPQDGQLLFPSQKKVAAGMGGLLVLLAIFLLWLYGRPGSPLHGIKGLEKLGFALFVLFILALAGWNLYHVIVGRSFLIDGKAKLVSRNGERIAGFGGIRSVELLVGYHPAIFPVGRSYAICLRLKSGESLPLIGLRWIRWYEPTSTDDDGSNNEFANEFAADNLEQIAQEVAELIGVKLGKSER